MMKTILTLSFLFGSLGAFAQVSGIGGYMSGPCYNGNFRTGIVCMQKTVTAETNSYNSSVNAQASYSNSDGTVVQVTLNFVLNDPKGYFRSFNDLPISGWASVCGYHRDCAWHNVNFNLSLQRDPSNPNQYRGSYSYQTFFSAGSEYTELTQWVTFSPYQSSEKLVFDLR